MAVTEALRLFGTNSVMQGIIGVKEERVFNSPYRTRLPTGPCGKNPNGSPLRIALCGFTRQTQNIKRDFAVCNDFQSCNSDSQTDSNKTLAPYYRQKTLAQIYPNAANVAYRKEKICNRFSC